MGKKNIPPTFKISLFSTRLYTLPIVTHLSASDSFSTMALYKSIYILTYLLTYLKSEHRLLKAAYECLLTLM